MNTPGSSGTKMHVACPIMRPGNALFGSKSRPLCNEAALLVLGTARVDEVGSVSSIRRDGRPSHILMLYYV